MSGYVFLHLTLVRCIEHLPLRQKISLWTFHVTTCKLSFFVCAIPYTFVLLVVRDLCLSHQVRQVVTSCHTDKNEEWRECRCRQMAIVVRPSTHQQTMKK